MNCKRTAAACLVMALSLSLSACGQQTASNASSAVSSVASSKAASPAVSSTSSAAKPLVKATLALDPDTAAPLLGGLYAADAQGYFAKCGLDVTFKTANSGAQAAELAASNTVQFTTAGQSTIFAQTLCGGKPLTAVAALLQHSDAGVLTQSAKNINRPKLLEGITCQTGGKPLPEAKLSTVVTADGGKINLVKTEVGTDNGAAAALKAGATAVCGSYSWDGITCRESNLTANFLFFRDVSPELDDYPLLLVANNTFLNKQPQAAKDFLTAVKMGYSYAAAHPESTAKLVCAKAASVQGQQAIVQRSLTWLAGKYTDDAARWGLLDAQRWNRFYSWMNQNKLTTKSIPLGTGISNSYLQ